MTRPMLAFRYQDKKKHLSFPCVVQPKLNGIRMLAQNGVLKSRSHGLDEPKEWSLTRLLHIRQELEGFFNKHPNKMLDGELYIHGESLQKINSYARVTSAADHDKSAKLYYCIFDCFHEDDPELHYADRMSHVWKELRNKEPIRIVNSHIAFEELHLHRFHRLNKSNGYEGTIIRELFAPYGTLTTCGNKENRWPYLLKLKDWLDDEFEIIRYQITYGRKNERGFEMTCLTHDGKEFSVGSGLSHFQRDFFEQEPPIGQRATIKFECYSDAGIPLKPSILEINE